MYIHCLSVAIAEGLCLQPHVSKHRELNASIKPQREKKMKIHALTRQIYSS